MYGAGDIALRSQRSSGRYGAEAALFNVKATSRIPTVGEITRAYASGSINRATLLVVVPVSRLPAGGPRRDPLPRTNPADGLALCCNMKFTA
jgi:hypothetical protein